MQAKRLAEVPAALGKLSKEKQDSLRLFVREVLQEWGAVGDNDLETLCQQYGLEKKDSIEVCKFIKEDEDVKPLDLASKQLKIGKGEYELGAVLGSGKYAEVRRGRNIVTRKLFALKFLFVDCSKKELRQLREQMRDELRAFKKIHHQNVVRLHDFDCRNALSYKGKPEKRPCMIQVQELCQHGELYDYVQYNGQLSEKLARTIMFQFAQGLRACHLAGIAHRDLKPDNILLDKEFRVKIADFGFAKSFVKGEGNQRRVNLRTILGTPGYMSPEMLMKMAYTEKTDIFSAGVILFILLAGYPPLQTAEIGDWWFERLLEGRYNKFWQAHERGPVRFSKSCKDLIINMLEPNPAERYSIFDVLESDWMKGEMFDKPAYRAHMKNLKSNVDKRLQELRNKAMTRNTEIDAITRFVNDSRVKGWKPSLRRLCENKYVHALKAVQSENDLMTALNTIESEMSCHAQLRMNLKIEDSVTASTMLANATDLAELQEVLSSDVDTLEELQKVLRPLTKTAVDGHILGMEGRVHERFFELNNVELPVFDPEVHDLPLHTYRFSCGFDILCFALRYITKAGKFSGRMNPWSGERAGLVQIQFEMSRENKLPAVEEVEMTEAEIKRRKALSLPIEAPKNFGGNVQVINYLLNLEIQCYQDPENDECMIVTIQRVGTNFQFSEDLHKIVEALKYETCLNAFLEGGLLPSQIVE